MFSFLMDLSRIPKEKRAAVIQRLKDSHERHLRPMMVEDGDISEEKTWDPSLAYTSWPI